MYTYFVKSVDRVVDGDTVDISIDLGFDLTKKERVRLAGIDTPETRTKDMKEKELGYEAKEFLQIHLMKASKLTVKTEKDGKYGRMLGWLYKTEEDNLSINELMVNEGYAWSYDGGTKEKNLDDLLAKRN
jgi:micrococcal nuclease